MFRLATIPHTMELLAELGIDALGAEELRELLADAGRMTNNNELCDGPFRPKRKFRSKTRFSDGSFPVFYSSLETSTAEAEIRYWFPQYGGQAQRPRTGYYQRFSCTFEGIAIDLRPKIDDWPDLVHDTDYEFCNQLGAEAKTLNIDGFETYSARHEGTNVPIFERQTISNPHLEGLVAVTYYPDSGEAIVADVST